MNLYTLVAIYLRDGHPEITVTKKDEVIGVIPKDRSHILVKLDSGYTSDEVLNAQVLYFAELHNPLDGKRSLLAEVEL